MTSSDTLLVNLEEGVLTLTLNRPDKLNAFNEALHLALRAQIQRAEVRADDDTEVRAVLLTGARALAARLAAGPTFGLGLTKRLIQDAMVSDFDSHLDRERDGQRQAGRTDDYAEGVAAFLEKRPARFQGR